MRNIRYRLEQRGAQMIHDVIDRWHQHLRGELPGGLASLLADDVVFYSPVVFTPQRGKEVTLMYLSAASVALPGEKSSSVDGGSTGFHYTKKILDGNHAMLEFESTIDGKYVNGVDIITCNNEGLITEFRVMVRPLQGVQAIHRQMGEILARMSPPSEA